MLIKTTSILLIILLANLMNGQSTFIKTLPSVPQEGAAICQLSNGNIIIGTNATTGQEKISILTLDSQGQLIHTIHFNGHVHDLITTNDGGFVMVGWRNTAQNSQDGLATKFNGDSQVQWSKRFGSIENEELHAVITTSDGHLLMVGYAESYNATSNQDILIQKLNLQGQVLWQKIMANNGDEAALDVVETNQGYVITGYHRSTGIVELDGFILHLDNNGQIQQYTTQGDGLSNCYHTMVTIGNSLWFGGSKTGFNNRSDMTLVQTDAQGTVQQSFSLPIQNQNFRITKLINYTNQQVIGIGESVANATPKGYLFASDTNGNVLWSKSFLVGQETTFKTIMTTSDGHLIAVGSSKNPVTHQKELIIIKTDATGQITNCSIPQVENLTTTSLNFVSVTRSLNTIPQNDFSNQNITPQILPNTTLTTHCTHQVIAKFTADATAFCEGNCTQFYNQSHATAQQWTWHFEGGTPNTYIGETPPTICYIQSGSFKVTLTVTHPEGIDSVEQIIEVQAKPNLDLGADITLCPNETLNLQVNTPYTQLQWQDGSTASNFEVTSTGQYWVETIFNHCTVRDTISIDYHDALPINLGADTTICEQSTLPLTLNFPNATYIWQDGSIFNTFTIQQAGTYTVEVTDDNGCTTTDSIQVQTLSPPVLVLPNDTTVCNIPRIELNAYHPSIETYQWQGASNYFGQNNPTHSSFTASFSDTYQLTVSNQCATVTQTITVTQTDCSCQPFIPTAFSPNQDGVNDELTIFSNCTLHNFSMQIFDRWGNLLFQTNDVAKGWNGTANGQRLSTGVYVCKVGFTATDEQGVLQLQTLVEGVSLME